jgi:hypothetical protein
MTLKKAILRSVLCLGIAATPKAHADFVDWQHSEQVFLNTTETGVQITREVHDFPLLIRLDSENFSFDQAQSDGADIRFAGDGGEELAYQIEEWDAAAQRAAIWVLVDTIEMASETQAITMYWGNASASDASDPASVFSSAAGYQGVFHLESAEQADNATGDASFVGRPEESLLSTQGICGPGMEFPFENYGDNIQFHNHPFNTPFTTWTWSLWMRPDTTANQAHLLANFAVPGLGNKNGPMLSWGASRNQQQKPKASTSLSVDPGYHACSWTGDIALKEWHHVAMVGNAPDSITALYVDGQKRVCRVDAGDIAVPGHVEEMYFSIGSDKFIGIMDEVRISSEARDSSWIALCYGSQRGNPPLITGELASTGVDAPVARSVRGGNDVRLDHKGYLRIGRGLAHGSAAKLSIGVYTLDGRRVYAAVQALKATSAGALRHRLPLRVDMPLVVRLDYTGTDGGLLHGHTAIIW